MTTIYLDLLFLLNTGVDWLLLRASAYITRRSFSQRRLIFAACAGGFLACIRFCLVLPGWFSVLFAAAAAALLCTLAFGFSNLRELCILCALFTGISCLYAGLVTGFLRLPQAASPGLQTPDSIGYIKLPLMVFILSSTFSLAFTRLSTIITSCPSAISSIAV
jgi:hypothetical protein